MKRLAIALLTMLIGCVSGGGGRARQCPQLVVDNQNFYDVVVYNNSDNRIVRVPGLGKATVSSCLLLGHPEVFRVSAQAGAFVLSLRGSSDYLASVDIVRITIMPAEQFSYVWR